jgi:hypothetical protein
MPTPALPLLHQLLQTLHIPIHPPTLSSISPSLLLIILESLLQYRLDLPHSIRLCATTEDEVSVIKCILGVLADDLLAMDLTLVDPRRVVSGQDRELEVMIMAFAVVAKRKGLDLKPREAEVGDWSFDREEEEEEEERLQEPMIPDISFSSPTFGGSENDVFASPSLGRAVSVDEGGRQMRGIDAKKENTKRVKTVLDEILEEFGV